MSRVAPLLRVAPAAIAAWNAAPLALCVPAVRLTVNPTLAGVGRPDHVALTFDDGPDARSTPQFLEELDRLGVSATFFLLGSMTERFPEVARLITDAGHEIGVHGTEHSNHQFRNPHDVRRDIAAARTTIEETTGIRPRWFRPPYGALSWTTLRVARELGMQTVLWTTWGRDWRRRATPESVRNDVASALHGGGTILLHDSDCTSAPDSWRATLAALPTIVDGARARGLTVGALRDHDIDDAPSKSYDALASLLRRERTIDEPPHRWGLLQARSKYS